MKLTLQIKLLPDELQAKILEATLREVNRVCDEISQTAWEKNVFNQVKLHHLVYHRIKQSSRLSAQAIVRAIAKVSDAYKFDRKTLRRFKPLGSIAYDSRILSYNIKAGTVSIWAINGRIKGLPFVCHNEKLLPYIKGEADLVTKKGKWYLFQTVEVPEEKVRDVEDFIGVDFGLLNIATLSTGERLSGKQFEQYRTKRQRVRSSLQRKGTKNSKRVLKRLSGRERRTSHIVNHTIAKHLVNMAKEQNKGVALEDLKGIRKSANNKDKVFRSRVGRWNFSDLRTKIEYKARLAGVPVVLVPPRYTSQMCNSCKHLGSRNGESFKCQCGNSQHSDCNAARNIRLLALPVNQSEKNMLFCAVA